MDGNQRQSQLTGTIEMNEIIRHFISQSPEDITEIQRGLVHPSAVPCERVVNEVAQRVDMLEADEERDD